MSINLSDLTSPNNQDIFAEITSGADFLDPIGKLKNLSRSPNKGGHALQTTALNQPRALPLIKNPAGNLGGYLYIPNVTGNYATGPSVTIGSNETWEAEVDMVITQFGNNLTPFGGGDWSAGFGMLFYHDGSVRLFSKGTGGAPGASGVTLGTAFSAKYGYDGTNIFVDIDGSRKYTGTAGQSGSITHNLELNQQAGITNVGNYAIQKAKLTVNSSVVFDCDFNGSTSIRHGDTKFQASVGGPVSLTRAGQDPVTVVKKDILRFDGVNDGLQGLFNQTITEGYLFAAFSILGDGGESYARMFIINPTGGTDSGHFLGFRLAETETFRSDTGGSGLNYSNMYNHERGDVLYEYKFESGDTRMRFNNATGLTSSGTVACSAQEFSIAASEIVAQNNASLDLEYLALFSVDSVPDEATASKIRNYINKRNVFYRWDTDGYYFYDAQSAPVGAISSGSASWNGRIVGSDNGDTDKLATQATANDQCVGDGFKVTFADNTDHLDIPSTSQSGWQIVGTSLGTFAYRVNNTAVTEINLLGNFGHANTRQTGDLYGIILLPESATSADIESARKILIDRGSSDALSATVLYTFWYQRADIVDFKNINMSSAVNVQNTWDGCSNMVKFEVTDISNGNNFSNAWKNCSALTSFPSGAKLGTSASNVNFSNAWRSSGLTSFPALDLSSGNNFTSAFQDCSALSSFPSGAKLGTEASNVNFSVTWLGCTSLTSFPLLDVSSGTNFSLSWRNCTSLISFPLLDISNATNLSEAWRSCISLITFPENLFDSWTPTSVTSGVFHRSWENCTSLTAQSVENILTSIDASGKHATSTGASGGTALGDAGIDIDYNTATGSLTAATNAAIESLSGKGWQVYINGEQIIPNILTLQPAAAYSLRSFDADADPNVVNVRRSTGGTSDFTASEVSDGTLTSWVNTDVDLVTPTLNNGGFEDGLTGWSTGGAVLDTSVAYAGSNSARFDIVSGGYKELTVPNSLQIGNQYKVTFWAKVSDSSASARADFGSGNLNPVNFSSTDWEYKEVTGVASGSTSFRFARDGGSPVSDFTVNFDNVTLTQLTADGHVTTWYDQSSNGRDSSQSTASSQPKLVDAGTLVTEGGLAALDFDGTDDYFQITNNIFAANFEAAVLANVVEDNTKYQRILDISNGTDDDFMVVKGNNDSLLLECNSTSGVGGLSAQFGSLGVINNYSLIYATSDTSTNSYTASVNGVSQSESQGAGIGEGNFTLSTIATRSDFLASSFAEGTFQEIVLFNTDQSANRAGIENNINDTYTIY